MPLTINLNEKSAKFVGTPRSNVTYSKTLKRGAVKITPIPTLDTLEDDILSRILGQVFECNNEYQTRLISKRFAVFALPFTLRTVSLSSVTGLQKLVSAPNRLLFDENTGKHIKCLELCFVPHNFELVAKAMPPITCPNLAVIRFRFKLGIPLKSHSRLEQILSRDTLLRAARISSNASWLAFLSMLSPTRFEWVSTDTKALRFVGLYNDLRQVFKSWKSLSSIYLDGICLIDQQNIYSWSIALPADYVHIRGRFEGSEILHFYHPDRIRGAKGCRLLVLEANTQAAAKTEIVSVAALSYGDTLVTLKGWSDFNRKIFVAGLTGKPLPLHLQLLAFKNPANAPKFYFNMMFIISALVLLFSMHIPARERRDAATIVHFDYYDHLVPGARPGWRHSHSGPWFSSRRVLEASVPAPKPERLTTGQAKHSRTEEPYKYVTYYHVSKNDGWVITSHYTTQTAQTFSPSNTQASSPRPTCVS